MVFGLIIIGALLVVVAFNNSMSTLASQLESDIPGYFKWAVAIAAIVGLGYAPGMEKPSRWLLALVLVVIVLKNYSGIIAGFQNFSQSSGAATGSGTQAPATQYITTGSGTPTQTQLAGGTSSPSSPTQTAANAIASGTAPLYGQFNPSSVLAAFASSSGFGSAPASSSGGNFQGPQTPDSLTSGLF